MNEAASKFFIPAENCGEFLSYPHEIQKLNSPSADRTASVGRVVEKGDTVYSNIF